jgi:hypothetical protein
VNVRDIPKIAIDGYLTAMRPPLDTTINRLPGDATRIERDAASRTTAERKTRTP